MEEMKKISAIVKRDIAIPDGKWAAHSLSWVQRTCGLGRFEGSDRDRYQRRSSSMVTAPGAKTKPQLLIYREQHQDLLAGCKRTVDGIFVGDEPFAVIEEIHDDDPGAAWGKYLSVAWEIHLGKYGHKPEIRMPQFVVQHSKGGRGRSHAWVQLGDLLNFERYAPSQLATLEQLDTDALTRLAPRRDVVGVAREFMPFTDLFEPKFEVAIATSSSDVESGRFEIRVFKKHELKDLRDLPIHTAWVRKRWSDTVLYLKRFGYQTKTNRVENGESEEAVGA